MTVAQDSQFGAQPVAAEERRRRIRHVFNVIAPRYDLMNDLMSFGIHRRWKRTLAARCAGVEGKVVDLAGGTGDIARLLSGPQRTVTVCDPSLPMMRAGWDGGTRPDTRDKPSVAWLAGEAEALPLADASIDLLTVGFGLRNATRLESALLEIHRVLKPGGRFVCLEFSRPQAWLAPFYDLYSRLVIPRLGATVAGQPEAYHYLIESIRRFPDQREFARLIAGAGFAAVTWEDLSFGIACLHSGRRPDALTGGAA